MTSSDSTELQSAVRAGNPFLVYKDHRGWQRIFTLPEGVERLSIGRSLYAKLVLSWDPEVSSMHAQLERMADDWVLIDDGLSRNGSFVNGERVGGRRRLIDGDELRLGNTTLSFHAPRQPGQKTMAAPRPD